MIRIVRDGVVVFESENLYEIADWLYYEGEEVKGMDVRRNEEAFKEANRNK